MSALTIRAYEDGDDESLSALFNRMHVPYAGIAVRTREMWRWAVLERPGVGPDRVLIAVRDGTAIGYAAMDRNGTVWEAVIDRTAHRESVADRLAVELLSRAEREDIGRVVVNVPRDDSDIRSALERAGFVAGPAPALVTSVMNLAGLLETMLLHQATKEREVIRLELSNTHAWQTPTLTIDTASGVVVASAEGDPSIRIQTSARDLNRLLLGDRDPIRELLAGRLRIQPLTKVFKGVKLLRQLRITGPWFHPLGDIL